MTDELNYYVDLRADFKHPDSIDEPSGEELAAILAEGLPTHGITVLKTEGIDFSYFVECVSGSSTIELMVGDDFLLDDADNRWYIQPCKDRSFFSRKDQFESDCRTLLLAVDKTLRGCSRISDIRWFPFFETPDYLALLPYSSGPVRAPDFMEQLHPLIRFDWRVSRILSAIASPLGIILGFLLFVVLTGITPKFVGYIALVATILVFGLWAVVPMVLSWLIGRKAKNERQRNGG